MGASIKIDILATDDKNSWPNNKDIKIKYTGLKKVKDAREPYSSEEKKLDIGNGFS